MTTPTSDILDALPHRPPFRFLTRVEALRDGKDGTAVWSVAGDEPFFAGHFPDSPIVPGVLITEALAQLSGLVAFAGPAEDSDGSSRAARVQGKLAHIEVRFRDSVAPPAEVRLTSRLTREFERLSQFEVKAEVDGRRVAWGTLTLTLSTTREAGP